MPIMANLFFLLVDIRRYKLNVKVRVRVRVRSIVIYSNGGNK
jgi:hypothetical protein